MERRTSCLQSNINFLQKTITKLGLDSRRQIDAASRRIEALEGTIAELKKTVAERRAREKKQTQPPAKEAEKDKAQESGKQ
jgi:DNA anti-recombination protein RmuC